LGEDLPITTYADMLSYLQYFMAPERLTQLQAIPPEGRGAAWTAFLHETDTARVSPENDALQDYFARLHRANERYAENGTPGWRTDRGMVLLLLGDPDQAQEQGSNDLSRQSRSLLWQYNALSLTVEFVFVPASGQWRLTLQSDSQVRAAARRRNGW
jgi:GWxTD domain-containing protein